MMKTTKTTKNDHAGTIQGLLDHYDLNVVEDLEKLIEDNNMGHLSRYKMMEKKSNKEEFPIYLFYGNNGTVSAFFTVNELVKIASFLNQTIDAIGNINAKNTDKYLSVEIVNCVLRIVYGIDEYHDNVLYVDPASYEHYDTKTHRDPSFVEKYEAAIDDIQLHQSLLAVLKRPDMHFETHEAFRQASSDYRKLEDARSRSIYRTVTAYRAATHISSKLLEVTELRQKYSPVPVLSETPSISVSGQSSAVVIRYFHEQRHFSVLLVDTEESNRYSNPRLVYLNTLNFKVDPNRDARMLLDYNIAAMEGVPRHNVLAKKLQVDGWSCGDQAINIAVTAAKWLSVERARKVVTDGDWEGESLEYKNTKPIPADQFRAVKSQKCEDMRKEHLRKLLVAIQYLRSFMSVPEGTTRSLIGDMFLYKSDKLSSDEEMS